MLLGAFRDVAFEIHEKIVDRTPIDTGRAKASWRMNPNVADPTFEPELAIRPNTSVESAINIFRNGEHPLYADQAAAVARAQQQRIPNGAQRIVISNNLHYIEKLENGSSEQAPGGMVAVTVLRDAVEAMFTRELQQRATPF